MKFRFNQNTRKEKPMSKRTTERTFNGLRHAMWDEIDALRNGSGDMERIRALQQLAGRINDTVHAEAKARKLLGTEISETANLRALLS
jgi:hypothetical protein